MVQKISQRPEGEMTADQRTSAFHVLMSTYLTSYPDSLQETLSYMELICGAARENWGNGWLQHDQQFRSQRQADPTGPLGMIDNQLWLYFFVGYLQQPKQRSWRPLVIQFPLPLSSSVFLL